MAIFTLKFPVSCHLLVSKTLSFSLCLFRPDAKHKAESELTPQTRPRSNTLPKSFGSTLDQSAYEDTLEIEARGHRPTREETLELIQECIQSKRDEDGWPEDVRVSFSFIFN